MEGSYSFHVEIEVDVPTVFMEQEVDAWTVYTEQEVGLLTELICRG